MERDEYTDLFRYRIGQGVRWADYPHKQHFVGQRRWTQREVLPPVVEYRLLLEPLGHDTVWMAWVPEADLELWEEQGHSEQPST
jgi:hypothetical protein